MLCNFVAIHVTLLKIYSMKKEIMIKMYLFSKIKVIVNYFAKPNEILSGISRFVGFYRLVSWKPLSTTTKSVIYYSLVPNPSRELSVFLVYLSVYKNKRVYIFISKRYFYVTCTNEISVVVLLYTGCPYFNHKVK